MVKNFYKIGFFGLLLVSPLSHAEKYEINGDFLNNGKIIMQQTADGKKFAVMDKKGKIRTSFDYDFILPVIQSPYGILASKQHKLGTLDPKTYQAKIPFIYDSLGTFNPKVPIAIATKDGKTGAITPNNKIAIPFAYRMIVENFKNLEGYSEQATIATPLETDKDFLLINIENQVLAHIPRPSNFRNYYVSDFENQLIALNDGNRNTVLMDWQGNVILANLHGNAILSDNNIRLYDKDNRKITTSRYVKDENGKFIFKVRGIVPFD